MGAIDMSQMKFFEVSLLEEPFTGAEVIKDSWWLTDEQGRVACYRGFAPQCNRNKEIAEMLLEKWEWAHGIVQIPVAFLGQQNGFYDSRHNQTW